MIKVLIFAANPRGTAPLDLPREFREIDEEVRLSRFRNAVELVLVPGTRPVDLLRKLNECQPQVVHFSSHGSPDEILLEAEGGQDETPDLLGTNTRSREERDMKIVGRDEAEGAGASQAPPHPVSRSSLVDVLRSCDEGNLRLVVLNACDTRRHAEALTKVVDCLVSMRREVTDRAAIKFAASFYGALAYGRSVQRAFDQGVARLRAEGIAEADTPELLVRAGVDPSRVVLVGSAPETPVPSAAEVPFLVPFPRKADFVGRDGDLMLLHASLSGPGPVGIRPAGLTGMGGIGKTQLAVEYVHRHLSDYSDGTFWIDAAGPMAEGFARLATDPRLRWAENDRPRDEQIRAAFAQLNRKPCALLVLDNLPDPAALAVPVLPGCTPEDLGCRLLFTTRRHDLGRFVGVEVTVLSEDPALQLLLRHPSRRAALDSSHPDHQHARAINRMLGRLPLALELAGAYLGKYSGDISLESYREGLRSDGLLSTLDADAAELTEADLRRVHDPAVAATIGEQWEAIGDESARLLLRVASLFPESAAVPIARLGLLVGLADEARPGRPSPLRRAVKQLDGACLVERLEDDHVRLHPLIREFAAAQTPPDQVDSFSCQCLERSAVALEHFPTLEALDSRRNVDGLQEDLVVFLELCPPSASELGARLRALLRLLQREANDLRAGISRSRPALFAQQIRNRAFSLGIGPLRSGAEQKLITLGQPHFRLRWKASRESPALIRTLTGHTDWVLVVTLTPDGHHALSGSFDGTLRLWDLATGQILRTFIGHERWVTAVAVIPDSRHALSGSADRTLRLWDLTTGELRRTFAGHDAEVSTIGVTPDGRSALSGAPDGRLRLWDLTTGQLLRTFAGHDAEVNAVAVTPDGRSGLSASSDWTLRLWDLVTGRLLRTFDGHDAEVNAVAVTPDGRDVVSGSSDCSLRVWGLETGGLRQTLAGHEGWVTAVAVTPGGQLAISGSYDRTLKVWNLATGGLRQTFAGHDHAVRAVAVAPDGHHAVSASDDQTLKLWDLTSSHLLHSTAGHDAEVSALAAALDGSHLLSASHDRTLKLWDLATGRPLGSFIAHDDRATAVAMTPDGCHAISGSDDRTLKLWDLRTGHPRRTFTGHENGVSTVAMTSDARYAISGSRDRTLRIWELETGRCVSCCTGHTRAVSSVAMTVDGRFAVSGSYDGTIRLWDFRTGQLQCTFAGHEGWVVALAVTSDGRSLLSGSYDRTLRLWDLATGQLRHIFAGHDAEVNALALVPDGRFALSASADRTLRLWDIEQGSCRATALLESSARAMTMTPEGRSVAVGDRVGNVHLFEIHSD
jgi:WD40 repeat protein